MRRTQEPAAMIILFSTTWKFNLLVILSRICKFNLGSLSSQDHEKLICDHTPLKNLQIQSVCVIVKAIWSCNLWLFGHLFYFLSFSSQEPNFILLVILSRIFDHVIFDNFDHSPLKSPGMIFVKTLTRPEFLKPRFFTKTQKLGWWQICNKTARMNQMPTITPKFTQYV